MPSEPFEVNFGVFARPLRKQLAGFRLPADTLGRMQEDADAIMRLRFRDLLTKRESGQAYRRLTKQFDELIKAQAKEARDD